MFPKTGSWALGLTKREAVRRAFAKVSWDILIFIVYLVSFLNISKIVVLVVVDVDKWIFGQEKAHLLLLIFASGVCAYFCG